MSEELGDVYLLPCILAMHNLRMHDMCKRLFGAYLTSHANATCTLQPDIALCSSNYCHHAIDNAPNHSSMCQATMQSFHLPTLFLGAESPALPLLHHHLLPTPIRHSNSRPRSTPLPRLPHRRPRRAPAHHLPGNVHASGSSPARRTPQNRRRGQASQSPRRLRLPTRRTRGAKKGD